LPQRLQFAAYGLGIWMINAERLLSNGKGALLQRLGFGIAALCSVELCEIVQTTGDIRVLRFERLLSNGKGALVQRLASA
jgi:hypothetical protein